MIKTVHQGGNFGSWRYENPVEMKLRFLINSFSLSAFDILRLSSVFFSLSSFIPSEPSSLHRTKHTHTHTDCSIAFIFLPVSRLNHTLFSFSFSFYPTHAMGNCASSSSTHKNRPTNPDTATSRLIDRQIRADEKRLKTEVKLLLLGR